MYLCIKYTYDKISSHTQNWLLWHITISFDIVYKSRKISVRLEVRFLLAHPVAYTFDEMDEQYTVVYIVDSVKSQLRSFDLL